MLVFKGIAGNRGWHCLRGTLAYSENVKEHQCIDCVSNEGRVSN